MSMKVKNVLYGLNRQFELKEINIIDDSHVIFSGPAKMWNASGPDMAPFKKEIEQREVRKRMMFNSSKVFIFV